MATSSEADVAAKLIERLLVDPAFRARFRRNPAEACREAGLDELAEEMQLGAGKAMMTLDMRESKSSLAGVMMAAAMEGVGIMQFAEHVAPHLDDIPEAIGDVLSRVNLPAIGGAFAAPPKTSAPPLPDGGGTGAAEGADAAVDPAAAGGNGAAPSAAAPAAAGTPEAPAAAGGTPEAPAAAGGTPEAPAAAGAGPAAADVAKPKTAAEEAAEKIAKAESPEAKRAEQADKAVADITEDAKDVPSSTDLPGDTDAPKPSVDIGPDGKALTPEQAAAQPVAAGQPAAAAPAAAPVAAGQPVAAAPAPPAAIETPGAPPPEPSGSSAQAAAEAAPGGGSSNAAAEALLQNKNLVLDADAQKDIRDGDVDPRLIGLLGKLTEKHKIELSVIKTGHDKFTSGGSVSNHFEGRGLDIARVDGEIVNPASTAARDLATEIAGLTGDLRPTEVGTPWAISESGFFTDGGHQDHVHVAFDGEPPAGFQPQAPAASAAAVAPAAPAAAGVAAAAPAAPGAPPAAAAAAAAPPEPKKGQSGQFMAAVAEASSAKKKGASGVFLAPQPPAGPPAAVASAASVPGMVDAAAVAPGGGGGSAGAAALKVAQTQLGVHEQGVNTGAEVDKYLASAKVAPGNPWCASFVTWSLEKAGVKMDGTGWAAVQTWVRNAEAGKNNLEIVSADQARPGDIVAYDWGHQDDFGSDGHIGFLASNVEGGKFTALEGNNQDQVMKVPRGVDMANVKFIRVNADAPGGAPAMPPAGAPAGVADQAAPAGSGANVADAVAAAAGGGGPNPYPGDDAPKEQLAAWLGREAEKRGLPKELPVMASLVESGVKNLNFGDADSVGFFQMRVGIWNQGEYAGFPEKPELQAKWFLDQAEAVKKQRISRGQSVTDPNEFGNWIADVERPAEQYRGRYQLRLDEARGLLAKAGGAPPAAPAAAAAAAPVPGAPVAAAAAAAPPEPKPGQSGQFMAAKAQAADAAGTRKGGSGVFLAPQPPAGPASAVAPPAGVPGMVDATAAAAPGSGASTLGASALKVAQTQLGVHEQGVNTGAEVDKYLASAKVAPGNPWCASFVTWSLEQAGHKMDGGGWAAVQTWVRNAEAKQNDLQIVSADQARPGDIVAYDWGHQDDFGSDGHIGFLASNVEGGKFTALEGNNQDQVMKVPRGVDMANVKFIRIGGDAPPPAGVPAAGVPAPNGAGVADVAAAAVGGGGGGNPYPGDTASKAQLATWLGREAEKRGLPKQLPVMASLVESGVKNLNYGDADSVGFFQMRVGIWNKGEYAGFPEKPELQAKWFLDQAEAVKKQRLAAGKSVTDPKQFGDWIADIERPAEQYRGRYALRLNEANSLLGSSASAPPAAVEQAAAAPTPAAGAVAGDAVAAAAGGGGSAGPKALAALAEAQKYTGTKYHWGGSTPQTGFDCSGLVQWAYAKAGIQIPRVTDAQFSASNGSPVERGDLRPGDLVFFGEPGNIYHVGISMGGDKFLHAPKTGDVVKVASLKESYFSSNYAGARRFDDSAPVAAAAAAVPEAPAAAVVDPKAVAEAQAAVARDAAEVKRQGSGLFMAIKSQEERRHQTVQFMQAVDPKAAKSADAPAAAAAAAPAAAPAAVEPSAAAPAAAPASAEPTNAAGTGSTADAGEPVQLPDDISDDYPGNNASKDEIAKWLAKQADKHGLPPELPVMASLVESGVKNLNYGDADSVGFFQMRVGIWNQGAYKGFSEHPELQAKWFIDQALAVKKKAIASGDANFGKDPSKWGEWIADIERPAEQYRGRYQLRLKEARGLLRG